MRVAHFSDLHLLSLQGVSPRRFLNKRLTGWANLRLKRGAVHRSSYVRSIAREIATSGVDHVVITGDLTNLALESEFALARDVIDHDLGLAPSKVTVVPGNHDMYTRGAMASRRFERYFADWLVGDLPELAVDVGGARYPVVKLCGSLAIIALTSAVPRLPFIAAGVLGPVQLEALARVLVHPEVARRTPIFALHHPVVQPSTTVKHYVEGLRDAPWLLSFLRPLSRGLVIHGHLHRRVHRTITTATGHVDHIGATSASLQSDSPERMAGFNLYELGADGPIDVKAMVFDPDTESFHQQTVPLKV